MRLLQVELVGHGRGDLRDLNLVSNLKYSLSEELTVLSRSLPEDTVCRSVQSSCDQWPAWSPRSHLPSSSPDHKKYVKMTRDNTWHRHLSILPLAEPLPVGQGHNGTCSLSFPTFTKVQISKLRVRGKWWSLIEWGAHLGDCSTQDPWQMGRKWKSEAHQRQAPAMI